MSKLLRAVRSFDQNCRHTWPSEESDRPSGRPIEFLRDFHASESMQRALILRAGNSERSSQ